MSPRTLSAAAGEAGRAEDERLEARSAICVGQGCCLTGATDRAR
jgi:hypothetical protein